MATEIITNGKTTSSVLSCSPITFKWSVAMLNVAVPLAELPSLRGGCQPLTDLLSLQRGYSLGLALLQSQTHLVGKGIGDKFW